MCFSYDALPPELPSHVLAGPIPPSGLSASGVSSDQHITLTSADGTQFSAYVARPNAPNGAGIVILPDVRGLFRFYEELAVRFAVAGVEAIAIDYFGRTAGLAPRGESFEFMPHVMQTKPDQIAQDVDAAVSYLRSTAAGGARAIFTVGFCFGGGNSFMQAANKHGLSGVIGFYGRVAESRVGGPTPLDLVGEFECPVLGLFGGADQSIPAADVHQFDEALAKAGVEREIVIYPGAPHSFFDRTYEQYQAESADAWQRMLSFIGKYTPRVQV
jgi:carboxymethylenebutenolidase